MVTGVRRRGYCPRWCPTSCSSPYFLEATMRFVDAAVGLPDVRAALSERAPEKAPGALAASLATYVRVDDCLDARSLLEGVREAGRRLG
jgi:hypothetical protein